ncbi:hypothetical protein QYF36_012596 [Acer negundo]|nr:hypothetical protein QYF36_012596 [Acer negundo]
MILALVQFQIILLVLLLPVKAWAQTAAANCTSTCGNVTIPFPFGIGEDCSLDSRLTVDCNHSKPYLGSINNLELLDISIDGSMRINYPVYNRCGKVDDMFGLKLLTDHTTPFIFSPNRNNFVGIGNCGNFSLLTRDDSVIASCSTTCNQNNDASRFCQKEVVSSLKGFFPTMATAGECPYSALVERQWLEDNLKNPQDIKHFTHVPVMLDWSVFTLMFDNFEKNKSKAYMSSSTCEKSACSCFSAEFPTVQCKCLRGFQGNPYLLQGCQGVSRVYSEAILMLTGIVIPNLTTLSTNRYRVVWKYWIVLPGIDTSIEAFGVPTDWFPIAGVISLVTQVAAWHSGIADCC